MNKVGVPSTWSEARPLSTSRRIRSTTALLVNAGQRKMAEREPHVPAELLFDSLDRVESLPRVRALVIAVLDNQMAGGRAADVIDLLIQRRQGQLAVVRCCVASHGHLLVPAGRSGSAA